MDIFLNFDLGTVLYLLIAGFAAAFIDASVGGGGLISLPAFLSLGWPVPTALGTNKLSALVSLGTSALTYIRSGHVEPVTWKVLPLSFVSAILGVLAIYVVPPAMLRGVVIVLLVLVGVYTLLKKNLGQDGQVAKVVNYGKYLAVLAACMGFYDGFFGPGSGMFYIFILIMMGQDYIGAAANSKVMTSAAMLGALPAFAWHGSIMWQYGLVMAVAMIPGAICGSKFVLHYGAKWIRPLFIVMVVIMIGKQVLELVK